MQSRSIAREISLLVLGQTSHIQVDSLNEISINDLLSLGLETLFNHWRDQLDTCANQLESAKEKLSDSELVENDTKVQISTIRSYLQSSLSHSEDLLNNLSDVIELSTLLSLSEQPNIRKDAIKRVALVLEDIKGIDNAINNVMEGWRLKRLPKIDQDILRLAYIDIYILRVPIPIACNEAVNLANRYSDEQGRKMINGILRRLHSSYSTNIA
ncbi:MULTISPECIES: transcription antitermination factor NusB [Prochlorococcus]|uniref:transcription antitermination factor NusB n=1 Tax=Prochlorococcus TaxID=1218 RepID=UPI00053386CA|nr:MULTISPECIES: transcription antitermination factor NusB [Prochlorococcus]KGG13765.1 Transcription termination protein NusB [Prochlorococcus sp. MIT 0601]